jgi:hypothetical protein
LCDVFDQDALCAAVRDFRPDIVVHQVTDLPDRIDDLDEFLPRNNRVRSEGTRNLLAAAQAANSSAFVAQSIAWRTGPGTGPILDAHENSVIAAGGAVLRYGLLYGPETFFEKEAPPHPRVHVDDAARRTDALPSRRAAEYSISQRTTPRHETRHRRGRREAAQLHVPGDPLISPMSGTRRARWCGIRRHERHRHGEQCAGRPRMATEDHGHLPVDVAFGALRRIADAVRLPVTADLEDGYGLTPAEFVDRLVEAGACGANLEDTDQRAGTMVDPDSHADRIAAIKSAARARGFDLVINAASRRPLSQGAPRGRLEARPQILRCRRRLRLPIFLRTPPPSASTSLSAQTNVLYSPRRLALRELAGLGVARISVASFLFRSAAEAARGGGGRPAPLRRRRPRTEWQGNLWR